MNRTLCVILGATLAAGPTLARAADRNGDDDEADVTASEETATATSKGKSAPFDEKWLEPHFSSGPMRAAAERFRDGDYGGAIKDIKHALPSLSKTEHNPARFLLAMAHMNVSDWAAATKIFEELWTEYPVLAPYHAYYAARCHVRQGDTVGALTWAARVPTGSVLEAESVLVKIDALLAEKRWAELETEATSFLSRFPAGPRRAEASFRQAEAMQQLNRPIADQVAVLRRIWAEAPQESWATRAEERLNNLAKGAPSQAQLFVRSARDWNTRGMQLFDKNSNVPAEAAFTAALAAPGLDKDLECNARHFRAQSVWKQRQRPRAAPLFVEAEVACRRAGDNDLVMRSLYQGARCWASSGSRDKALAQYAVIEKEFPTHRLADDARLRSAEVMTDSGDLEGAEKFLQEMPNLYPSGDMAPEALWRLAFAAWRAGELDKALGWLDQDIKLFPREEIWYAAGRAHYWRGRIFDKKGDKAESRKAYEAAVREYPLSVYALMSLERLRTSSPELRTKLLHDLRLPAAGKKAWHFEPQPIFGEPGFQRAVELARMGLGSDARRELARLGVGTKAVQAGSAREDVLWIAAILLDRGHLWSASHSIPRNTLTGYRWSYPTSAQAEAQWRLSYPRAFAEFVARNSKANKVPEALQLAIMREESAFNPKAESFANALGLTQMLVSTAQRFAKAKVTRDTLLSADKNLELGSKFLGYLLEHFGGAAPLSIAGYNAGEAAVDRWLRERGTLETDEFMETIPYDETRNYTKRVLASMFAYSWLYTHDKAVPTLSFSLQKADAKKALAEESKADEKKTGKPDRKPGK
jgi:soluble lytic murein transglycosylase